MSGAQLSGLIIGLVLVIAAAILVLGVRRKGGSVAAEPGRPDAVSEQVVSGLLAELRKWQAEAAYWKEQAGRLQRELDERAGSQD